MKFHYDTITSSTTADDEVAVENRTKWATNFEFWAENKKLIVRTTFFFAGLFLRFSFFLENTLSNFIINK